MAVLALIGFLSIFSMIGCESKDEKAAVQPITEMANSIWGESRVEVSNDTGMTYPEHSDTNMSYEQFLKLYPMNWQLVQVYLNCERFINSNGDMDEQAEIDKYKAFAQKLADHKYMRSSISIWYITPGAYDRFDEAKNSDMTVINYFKDEENEQGKLNLVTANGIDIDEQGQIVTTNEELHKGFDIWKEERVKSTKLKNDGGSYNEKIKNHIYAIFADLLASSNTHVCGTAIEGGG
ncbi:hypothetical protein MUG84_24330 [Paenibacillus sp. KQZ6P-2]|uniref:Uncharacterized protein n=1 Tax=Paenibacillus mangrovi TaxID=2931978 RepID=A0A9X1WVT4_9BACL|nr:hypothetical protein [Paenibacillus mangrovi]MCJ8014815.1 hypothetical protein [Paenibacillus mangrovi]